MLLMFSVLWSIDQVPPFLHPSRMISSQYFTGYNSSGIVIHILYRLTDRTPQNTISPHFTRRKLKRKVNGFLQDYRVRKSSKAKTRPWLRHLLRILFKLFYFYFWDTISLCSPTWPIIHLVSNYLPKMNYFRHHAFSYRGLALKEISPIFVQYTHWYHFSPVYRHVLWLQETIPKRCTLRKKQKRKYKFHLPTRSLSQHYVFLGTRSIS